jgi:hypothetical protein
MDDKYAFERKPMPQGIPLNFIQKVKLCRMIRCGRSQLEIMAKVGCSVKTITAYRHKVNGTKPNKEPQNIGFLSSQHISQIGQEEAERLLLERKNIVDFFGFRDSFTGEWHEPRFKGYYTPTTTSQEGLQHENDCEDEEEIASCFSCPIP